MMMAAVMVAVMMVGLFLNPPLDVKKIVGGTRQPQRPRRVVTVDLMCLIQKPLEKWMVKVGYGNHEPLKPSIFLQSNLNRKPPFLHLRLLVFLHRQINAKV